MLDRRAAAPEQYARPVPDDGLWLKRLSSWNREWAAISLSSNAMPEQPPITCQRTRSLQNDAERKAEAT
jgi:hypothetical protein